MAPLRLIPALGSPIEITQDVAPVGREHGAVVRLTDVSVSRKHARIERRGSDWVLVDLGSANGSFVDGVQVEGEQALRNGQEIRFGDMTYRVEAETSVIAAAAEDEEEVLPTVFHFKAPPPPAIAPAPVRPAAAPVAPAAPPAPATLEPAEPVVSPTDSTLVMPAAESESESELPAPITVPMAALSAAPPPGAPAPPTAPGPPGAPSGIVAATPRVSAPTPTRRPAAAAATARSGRGPLFWVVAGSIGCLSLVGVLAGLGYATIVAPTKSAIAAVQQQLDALRKGDVANAHSRLQGELQTRIPLADFARFVSAHPSLSNNVDALFWPPSGSARVERNRAYLNGVLVAVSGVREQVAYELVKEGAEWRVSTLRVEGREPEASPSPVATPEPAPATDVASDPTDAATPQPSPPSQ